MHLVEVFLIAFVVSFLVSAALTKVYRRRRLRGRW